MSLTLHEDSQVLLGFTCLAATSWPSGIGAPFSEAMRLSVARALSWFPLSTSYRALSGSHCSAGRQETVSRTLRDVSQSVWR